MDKVGITCLKTLFMLFNIVLLAFGLVLLILGVWMKVQLSQYFETLTEDSYDLLPWILIGIGLGVVVIGILGCLCTSKGIAPLLYLYSIFLMIIFIAAIAIGIYGFIIKGKVSKTFDEGLTKSMETYVSDENSKMAMDQLQITLKCCGKNSSKDWFNIPWENGTETSKSAPLSCCIEEDCDNTDTSALFDEGCYIKVTSFVKTYFAAIGGSVIGFAFVQLLGGVVAFQLAKHINKLKYDQMQ